jgi:hypothetical protein
MKKAVFAGAALLLLAVGCYKGDPPCNPGTVDWPRCDPTQPSWGAKVDGGAPDAARKP